MRALASTTVFAAAGCLMVVAAAPAAAGGTVTVDDGPGRSATVTINDYVLRGPECQEVPFSATFRLDPDTNIFIGLSAYTPGSTATMSGGIYADAPATSGTDGLTFCPFSNPLGTYIVTATGAVTEQAVPVGQISISAGPSSAAVGARTTRKGTVVTGKATVVGPNGDQGLQGTYHVATLTPKKLGGNGKWRDAGTASPDTFGRFTQVLTGRAAVPKGSTVRLIVTCEYDSCVPSTATATVR